MRAAAALTFVRCETCTHAGLSRGADAPCRMCGARVAQVLPPPDLAAWRCGCFQCTWTPC